MLGNEEKIGEKWRGLGSLEGVSRRWERDGGHVEALPQQQILLVLMILSSTSVDDCSVESGVAMARSRDKNSSVVWVIGLVGWDLLPTWTYCAQGERCWRVNGGNDGGGGTLLPPSKRAGIFTKQQNSCKTMTRNLQETLIKGESKLGKFWAVEIRSQRYRGNKFCKSVSIMVLDLERNLWICNHQNSQLVAMSIFTRASKEWSERAWEEWGLGSTLWGHQSDSISNI